ncbi:hypothetical protein QTG54_014058 [Skeletonema marinoi]|uniref:Uncharacterized protein n=1 Tax=Skeletonema marinoi TaxID=267567 RepID=A0AAD8XWY8_9STRA|nr:hypothetical protein QTG54_014058 [Skeletonema marinoi]
MHSLVKKRHLTSSISITLAFLLHHLPTTTMKLSVASLVFFLSVGGVAASQDLLLRGSETSNTQFSRPSRQLKNPNAKGKPAVVNWRCKDSPFDTCATFAAGRGGGDTCQQCCECECDETTDAVVEATPKCSDLQEEDALTSVSCSDDGMVDYNATIGSCDTICETACGLESST